MLKRYVDWTEWYPVFTISADVFIWEANKGPAVEFTEDEIQRIENAEREFRACQEIIERRYKSATDKKLQKT